MKEEIKRMEWETEISFNYRVKTGEIVTEAGKILKRIQDSNYGKSGELESEMKKLLNKLKSLKVPEIYNKPNEFLLNCISSYVKSFNILGPAVVKEDSNQIYKAGRYINEGNAWMELAKIKIWEAIEGKLLYDGKEK